jgi:hypothetical protein
MAGIRGLSSYAIAIAPHLPFAILSGTAQLGGEPTFAQRTGNG